MADKLLSVGLDIGTTSTQLIVSELTIENKASAFSVPQMEIAERNILYKSPIHFTPLLRGELVDGEGIRAIVTEEYQKAGISRSAVDTGAVIITGETSRKENAATVLHALSDFSGDFVVATAGPDLESILAAKGAGAVDFSAQTGKTVLHMDIGGGTSNLALIENGRIIATGCLNVGGRLLKFDKSGAISYISPVLGGIFEVKVGDIPTTVQLQNLADTLVSALEMAAGLQPPTQLLENLWTKESDQNMSLQTSPRHLAPRAAASQRLRSKRACGRSGVAIPASFQNSLGIATSPSAPRNDGEVVISLSGGVADCIETDHPDLAFGDMGPILGRAIRRSRLCAGPYRLGTETIRATVIGAGSHATQLSGSTIFHQNVTFPLKNLPVVTELEALSRLDTPGVLALPGHTTAHYAEILALADDIAENWPSQPIYIVLEADMAKALGHALALRLPQDRPILCIDRVRLHDHSYLDVGAPIATALPVVVKTLILNR